MLTEDSHRRRELASVGITAEVEGDGHKIVATFDRPQFDALVAALNGPDDSYEYGFERGHAEGYRDAKAEMKPAADKTAVGA
jgi:hypothetical protein